jgi:hypothetical protein
VPAAPASADLRRTLNAAAGDGAREELRPAGRGGQPRQRSRKETVLFHFHFFFFAFSFFSIFNLPDKWALCPHQQAYFFFAMSGSHVGPYCQFECQFVVN